MDDEGLAALNARLHEALDDGLLAVAEALTALDTARAREAWRVVRERLLAHARVEDGDVLAAYAARGATADAGAAPGFPRGGSPELLDADHRSLEKVSAAWDRALEALGAAPTRRDVVLALPGLYRVRSVLEHHTVREQTHLYPWLDGALEAPARRRLGAALEAAWAAVQAADGGAA